VLGGRDSRPYFRKQRRYRECRLRFTKTVPRWSRLASGGDPVHKVSPAICGSIRRIRGDLDGAGQLLSKLLIEQTKSRPRG